MLLPTLGASVDPARAEPPPVITDLAAALNIARQKQLPLFVAFTWRRCPYCNTARRDYWKPMNERADRQAVTVMVEVVLDGAPTLRDFDSNTISTRDLGNRYGIRGCPR
ncbi:MAG: hypothetical protein FJY56_21140 [Betaproteobacteria bacterium]|nr:hypothetical protein [Betaproteobacteria bacterium]